VRNYLALLGWGTEESQEYFTPEELVREFSLERVSKSPAVFDEQKLRHMNGRYLRELALDDLTARLEALTGREGLRGAVEISQEKISTLADFWPLAGFLFDGPADDEAARAKWLDPDHRHGLVRAREALAHLEPFDVERIEVALREVVEADPERKPKDVFQPIRVALAGTTISPGIFESLAVLGREESLRRLDAALATAAQ
jgi:glutamyl/glutaminyl-tRNA synthetase